MNRKGGFAPIPVLLIVAAALLLGGLWYYASRGQQANVSTSNASMSLEKTYSDTSFSFNYPSSWIIGAIPGIVPAGSGDIDVATTSDVAAFEKPNPNSIAVTVGGVSCYQGSDPVGMPGVSETSLGISCIRGNEVWRMILTYRTDDGASILPTFDKVLASTKLL